MLQTYYGIYAMWANIIIIYAITKCVDLTKPSSTTPDFNINFSLWTIFGIYLVSDHLTDAAIIAYRRRTFRCSLICSYEWLTIVQSFTGLAWPHLRKRLKRCTLNITGKTATQTVVLHTCRNVADVFTSFRLHYTKLFARWRTYDGFYSGSWILPQRPPNKTPTTRTQPQVVLQYRVWSRHRNSNICVVSFNGHGYHFRPASILFIT